MRRIPPGPDQLVLFDVEVPQTAPEDVATAIAAVAQAGEPRPWWLKPEDARARYLDNAAQARAHLASLGLRPTNNRHR